MTEVELVKKFYEFLAKGNRQDAYSLLSNDFVLNQAASLPYGGEYIGVNGLNDFFQKFYAFWREFETLQSDYFYSDNKVFAISKIRGVVLKTGKIIETDMVQIYTVENQKLIFAQPFYYDTTLLTTD